MSTLLPPELLLKVFVEVQNMYSWYGTKKAPPCLAVSQVCRRWRTVALEASCLWTRLPLDSLKWVETCISRSRSSCLEVNASFLYIENHAQRQSLYLVYPELPRIGALNIGTEINYDGSREILAEVFAGLSLRPAPKLRELEISLLDSCDIDRPPTRVPSSLFASQRLVSLETMTLSSCKLSLSWSNTLIAPSLRTLRLYESLLWKNVDEMVQFFELVPNLEILDLTVITTQVRHFNTTTSSAYPYRSASLPQLKSFDVSTRFLEDVALLTCLSMPPTTLLKMNVSEADWDLMSPDEAKLTAAYDRGSQAIRDHFATSVAAGHGYTHLRIHPSGVYAPCTGYSCQLHNNSLLRESPAINPVELAPITLDFGIPERCPHLIRPAYAMILDQPVLETATTVCLQGRLLPEAWSCLDHWTAVETLALSKSNYATALPGFVAALRSQGSRLFPALRELYIVDTNIVKPDEPENETYDQENDQEEEDGDSENDSDESDSGMGGGGSELTGHVRGEGLRGTDSREFIKAMRVLARDEHFERLVLTRCTMSTQTLQAVKDVFGAQRIEGNVQSPEEKLQAREESRREMDRWLDEAEEAAPSDNE
ncbi:hypothetical protein PENSPDRAFT_230708 [Peniophora sp. CONT]|nr:hypothetical protein PENSPDRAFT_230708 [Peniophora sp. CONT]